MTSGVTNTAQLRRFAIWIAVGGVLGAVQCHGVRRATSPPRWPNTWDGPPARVDVVPEHVAHKAPRHHVIGI